MDLGQFKQCIIIFLRSPEKGKVKTRLSENIPSDVVLELYKNMVADVLTSAKKTRIPIRIFFYPENSKYTILNWLGESFEYHPQKGNNLGEKMKSAFLETFSAGFNQAILIGTDCPDLDAQILELSFERLNQNNAVIGPAFDGGYYLIGFNSDTFDEDIFANILWGNSEVFKWTIDKFQNKAIQPFILPKIADMDTVEDLKQYKADCKNSRSKQTHTLKFLNSISL